MSRIETVIRIALIAALAGCTTSRPIYRVEADRLTIRIDLPGAETVLFASSLDGYRLVEARRAAEGTWEIQQPAGRAFSYFLMVDGRAYVPKCQLTEADDFGSRNCLFLPEL